MPGRSVPVVIIPRWTTYVGLGTFRTAPIPISAYDHLVLNFMAGNLIGTTPGASLACRESNDLQTWTPCGGATPIFPGPFSELQWRFQLTMAWMSFDLTLVGTNVAVTCYAEGFFELRER